MTTGEQFRAILDRAIDDAAALRPATAAEYREALADWIEHLRRTLSTAAEDEGLDGCLEEPHCMPDYDECAGCGLPPHESNGCDR